MRSIYNSSKTIHLRNHFIMFIYITAKYVTTREWIRLMSSHCWPPYHVLVVYPVPCGETFPFTPEYLIKRDDDRENKLPWNSIRWMDISELFQCRRGSRYAFKWRKDQLFVENNIPDRWNSMDENRFVISIRIKKDNFFM